MSEWTGNNELELLENGEQFYPRVFAAIRAARRDVLLETYIWYEDAVGTELRHSLITAAQRGATVRVLVDGYGSPGFSGPFLKGLTAAGVHVMSFDPKPVWLPLHTNVLCRMHRKIVIVDGEQAFVGGINFSDDHLHSFGHRSKQDYAIRIRGDAVRSIEQYCGGMLDRPPNMRRSRRQRWRKRLRLLSQKVPTSAAGAQVLFVARDNEAFPADIELMYRAAIANARHQIIIANAYFFPGFRFIRDLTRAADRGVDVRLIMQGNPDRPITVGLASLVYDDLLASGVKICRYLERPLHAKVAVIDDTLATIGSSNLDPTSLGLNLEANVFVLDAAFTATLRGKLERLISDKCEQSPDGAPRRSLVRRLLLTLAYHLTRGMHVWGRRVRMRSQHVRRLEPEEGLLEAAQELPSIPARQCQSRIQD